MVAPLPVLPRGGWRDQRSRLYGVVQKQVLDPAGKLIARYHGGNLTTSNVAFGGPKMNQLFITGGLGAESGAGGVFRIDLGVKGLVILPEGK